MSVSRRKILFGIAALPAGHLLAGRLLPGLTATVYNGYELHTALQAAGPDSSILLAPGDYGDIGRFILAGSNVSVRVQAPLRTILRVPLVVEGDFVELDGLAFEGGVHLAGAGEVIANSSFTGNGIDFRGVNTEVHHCDISHYSGRGIFARGTAVGANIHDNTIHDCLPGAESGIRIGASTRDTNKRVGARVVSNTCINLAAGSNETLSFKSSGNVMSGNRLINCNNIVNRHGEDNEISGNRLERSGAIVIQDARTLVANNVAAIRIMAGTSPWNMQVQGDHPQAAYTVLRGNSGALGIGRRYTPRYNYPAIYTRVESHNGGISLGFEQGTVLPGGQNRPDPDLEPSDRGTDRPRGQNSRGPELESSEPGADSPGGQNRPDVDLEPSEQRRGPARLGVEAPLAKLSAGG
jgi:hypothetical protein